MWPTAKIFNGRCDKIVRQKIEASYLYVRELWYVPFIVVGYNYQPLLKGFDIQYIYIYTHPLINLHISHFILTLAQRQDIISKNVSVVTPHNPPPPN